MLNRSNARQIERAVDAVSLSAGDVAADVGFGGGLGLRLMLERVGPSGTVHGIDVSADMVGRAARRFRAAVARGQLVLNEGSLMKLPLEDATVDGAITVNTVYFVAELTSAFEEFARVLKPSGRVVVGIGDPDGMARMPMTRYGFRLRRVDEIIESARTSGLELRNHIRIGKGMRAGHLLAFYRDSQIIDRRDS